MNVLHICASPRPISESVSKQLAAAFFTKLAELNPDVDVNNVDLYHNVPPFLNNEAYRFMWKPIYDEGYQPNNEEKKAAAYALAQAEMLKEADVLVLTMPMWNGGMPAIMKAWIDQVMVPNQIFSYGVAGALPLHHIKQAIVLVSSGETFKEGDASDALTPEVNALMKYLGIQEVAFAWADGQDPITHHDGEERKALAMEAAQELAEDLAGTAGTTAETASA